MPQLPAVKESQLAILVVQTRNGSLRMGVRVSQAGLLAIGCLVSSIRRLPPPKTR